MKRWCVSDSESEKELPFLGSILNLYVRSLHSSLGWLRSKLRYSFFYRGWVRGESFPSRRVSSRILSAWLTIWKSRGALVRTYL